MKIEFKITEQDFLDFHLFKASKSVQIHSEKRTGWILLTLAAILVAFLGFKNDDFFLAIYSGLLAILCGLFYPKFFKWNLKKNHIKSIRENYDSRFDQFESIEISTDFILSKDKALEMNILISEIDKVEETKNQFFLRISTGHALIIPKQGLSNPDNLKTAFKKIGLNIYDETNWSWD